MESSWIARVKKQFNWRSSIPMDPIPCSILNGRNTSAGISPTLIVWGKNDEIFPAAGATPYLRDLPKAELHLLDTGHFALEEDGDVIAGLMRTFLARHGSSTK